MKKPILIATLTMALMTLGLGGYYFVTQQADPFLLKPSNKKIVSLGRTVYADNCASCHGEKLEGEPNWQTPNEEGYLPAPPHDETGHTWHHPDDVLFGLTKFGLVKFAKLKNHKSNMPAYEDILSDEEIVAVLSFIKSAWSEEIRGVHDQRNALAAERSKP
ncbi:c-type cytochrome [Cohaesibacter intestini]|uniref:c-type cytochrome n=1 Tax=Cohaesibacter intestini TaxID=2211145 RepID=UPI000DE89E45|nr:cytochrome c [Cohaesibacter intestini]